MAPKVWTQTAELAQVGVAGTDGRRTLEELNSPMSFIITIVTREGIVMAADLVRRRAAEFTEDMRHYSRLIELT